MHIKCPLQSTIDSSYILGINYCLIAIILIDYDDDENEKYLNSVLGLEKDALADRFFRCSVKNRRISFLLLFSQDNYSRFLHSHDIKLCL